MNKSPLISIVIRAKNEEKWIASCLSSIFRQRYRDFEVVLVDNCSTDLTVKKAGEFNVKVVTVEDFYPGQALNIGIKASRGEFIVCISGHCIPVDEFWLENLLRNFDSGKVAGVYGRQEPMAFTNDLDKRDLINIFGLDKKVQRKDPFFHNANSMIRRDVWGKYPFDENVKNIEDRVWAQCVLSQDYEIVYEPEASVFHYHGINQGRNIERAKGVVKILEQIHPPSDATLINGLNITVVVPVCGKMKMFNGKPLIERTIKSAKKSKYVNSIVVASDNREHLEVAGKMNVEGILRPETLSFEYVGLVKVYQYVLDKLAEEGNLPSLLVLIEEIYPFRPPWLIDRLVENLLHADYDSVVTASPVSGPIWRNNGNSLTLIESGVMPSRFKDPVYRGFIGLGCVTHPKIIREGNKIGPKTGLIMVEDPFSTIALDKDIDMLVAEALESKWKEFQKDNKII